MDYSRLGSSGLTVSRIGLGMMSYGDPDSQPWALGEDDAEPIVRRAVDAGIIFFDVVRAGKARYIGASAMYAWQLAKAQYAATSAGFTRFVAMQNRYNLVNREDERELIPLCRDLGLGIVPYSPLARGLLAGTRERDGTRHTRRAQADRGDRPADLDVAEDVRAVAAQRGLPPAQIALAWLLARPGVTAPLIGATSRHHVDDAISALGVQLDDDEIARLEARYLPRLLSDYS